MHYICFTNTLDSCSTNETHLTQIRLKRLDIKFVKWNSMEYKLAKVQLRIVVTLRAIIVKS